MLLHSGVESTTKFPLAASVSRWTTRRDLSTGRPQAGITSERMFCSPCSSALVLPFRVPVDAADRDGLTATS